MLVKSLKLPKFFFGINQVKYVLSERFCQDPPKVLQRFGRQRTLGSRKDNQSMVDFGYNNNAIRNQKHFKPIANGNVAEVA